MPRLWIAAIALLCCASGLLYAQDRELDYGIVPTRSVWSGVYSAAQANRGAFDYRHDECWICHNEDLDSDSGVPALAGMQFMMDWDKQPVLDLVRQVHGGPMNSFDDIDLTEAADLVAFILRENGIPPG